MKIFSTRESFTFILVLFSIACGSQQETSDIKQYPTPQQTFTPQISGQVIPSQQIIYPSYGQNTYTQPQQTFTPQTSGQVIPSQQIIYPSYSQQGHYNQHTYQHQQQTSTIVHLSGSDQVAIQTVKQKALTLARNSVLKHLGGSFGGGRSEGVGYSPKSAQEAIDASCYSGSSKSDTNKKYHQNNPRTNPNYVVPGKPRRAVAVAKGPTGYFAVILYN